MALHRVGNAAEAQAADPFTYTRVPDVMIAGQAAKTYVNDEPFEFPRGTQEVRSCLQTDDFIYVIDGYVDSTNSGDPESLDAAVFNKIVSTFRLIR